MREVLPMNYWKDGNTYPKDIFQELARLQWHVTRTEAELLAARASAQRAEAEALQALADVKMFQRIFEVELDFISRGPRNITQCLMPRSVIDGCGCYFVWNNGKSFSLPTNADPPAKV